MNIITDSTPVDLTCDDENQDSIESLPTSSVNDVSIETLQNHQQSTTPKPLIVVNSAEEWSVDEQPLADIHKPYENNFTPINRPKASISRTIVHVADPLKFYNETDSPRGFLKASMQACGSRKVRIGEEDPRHSLSSPSDMLVSERLGQVNTRQNPPEQLSISEQSSHQVAPFTPSDSSYPVSPAHPKSFESNPAAYNGMVGWVPYLGPPIPTAINNLSYKAPTDPSVIPVAPLPLQSSAAEPRPRRRVLTCGNCGVAGHNLRTCPEDYCSYCAVYGHKLRDCALAKEEDRAIKQQKAEAARGKGHYRKSTDSHLRSP